MFTELDTETIEDGKRRKLIKDYTYENDKYIITIKKGFITDGASIPKTFWSVLSSPFYGPIVFGAMIHDGLYTKMTIPRKECDKLLKEMILEKGYNRVKANLVYGAVRMFGKSHWKENTSAKKHLVKIKMKGN